MRATRPLAVFFDLDGTLADTAEDLAAPMQAMRADRALPPMPLEGLRRFASMGARGLILEGLGVAQDEPAFEPLREEFLRRYETALLVHTHLFAGIPEVLDALDAAGIRWGVISNKPERYVLPILAGLGLLERSVCAIGGDTTAFPKPHPEPLLHGARLAAVEAHQCVYVGDDLRDIEAGRAAGTRTVAAAFGYIDAGDDPRTWGADVVVRNALELIAYLD